MAVCKTCGLQYHFCSSCGCDGYSEYDYCSSECMELSEEANELKEILESLDANTRIRLINLLNKLPKICV
jgi:hypothetical protein